MNKMFKIGYFADGLWSHKAFELLVQDKTIQICFIVPRADTQDKALFNYAVQYNIPYLEDVRVNSSDFYQKASRYDCDLFVSMSYNQIFKQKITNLPQYGTINCHAGKLPFYRGRNILNWALINDEKEFGITVHFIDEGIDSGDIILQRTFPITDKDNYSTLLNLAYSECAMILYDAIKLFQANSVQPIPQSTIHPVGMYCGQRRLGDERINWDQSSRELFNFIRAICVPGPIAETTNNGQIIKINRSSLIEHAPKYKGVAGQIIGKTNQGFLIKTRDSFLEIFDIQSDSKIRIGDRLI